MMLRVHGFCIQEAGMPTQRLPVVRETLCTRCGECVETCPVQALGVGLDGSVVVWPQACVGCDVCAQVCEPLAIAMREQDW